VERVINQMQVLEELRVDCVTQLLIESAHSHGRLLERGDQGGIEMEGLS
jgi:hypothetical protein